MWKRERERDIRIKGNRGSREGGRVGKRAKEKGERDIVCGHGYVCAYADDVRGGKDSLRVSPQYLPLQYVLDFLACGEFDQLRFPTGRCKYQKQNQSA